MISCFNFFFRFILFETLETCFPNPVFQEVL